MKISLCSLAITMAISMSSSAWAVNNDVNPLTGAPNEIPAIPENNAIPAPTNEVSSPVTPPEVQQVDNSVKDKETSETKDSEDDFSYDATENVLKKTSNLSALIEFEKKKKELKDLRNPPKENNNSQQAQVNGNMPFNGQNQQQGVPFQQMQQPFAPVKKEEPKVDIQATAVYSLGNTTYAEIYVNGNKFVAKNGTALPSGYKLVGMNPYGITLSKGRTKIQLPIVSSEAAAKAADLASSQAEASVRQNSNNGPTAMPPVVQSMAPIPPSGASSN